jgi:hypothetical protein
VTAAVSNDGSTVEAVAKIYLPVIVVAGQSRPPPTSPYAAALSQALTYCASMALNQVCYGGGSVTLDGSVSLDGGGPLTTPSQVATLESDSGLRLASPDSGHWSVALLRLAADSPTPDLGLTLLVFGNVEIGNLTLFDIAAGNGDAAPALSFSSSPVPGEDPETAGLIVYNPTHEEPLSIRLIGADLTLALYAVGQAQPGKIMTLTMASGSAFVNTTAGDGALIQAHQIAIPLDGEGAAAVAPTTPTMIDEELLEPLVPLNPTPALPDIVDSILADFDNAYDRCLQSNSRKVYRVMYFARILQLYDTVPGDLLSLIDVQVSQCATFEFEFNSVIRGNSTVPSGSMYLQEQGMMVSYGMDGMLDQPASMPLTHLSYEFDAPPECPYQFVLVDGVLNLLTVIADQP